MNSNNIHRIFYNNKNRIFINYWTKLENSTMISIFTGANNLWLFTFGKIEISAFTKYWHHVQGTLFFLYNLYISFFLFDNLVKMCFHNTKISSYIEMSIISTTFVCFAFNFCMLCFQLLCALLLTFVCFAFNFCVLCIELLCALLLLSRTESAWGHSTIIIFLWLKLLHTLWVPVTWLAYFEQICEFKKKIFLLKLYKNLMKYFVFCTKSTKLLRKLLLLTNIKMLKMRYFFLPN